MRASVKGKGHSRCHQRPRNKRSEKFVLNEDPSSGRQGSKRTLQLSRTVAVSGSISQVLSAVQSNNGATYGDMYGEALEDSTLV
jgi:hypothetical protein